MIAEPEVRADGLCVVCLKPRKFPARPPHSTISPTVYRRDPFCSSACCRVYYENPIPVGLYGGNIAEKRGRYDRTKVAA